MDNPVDDRHCNVVIVEKLSPAGEVLVGGQDDGPILVQAVDQLKQVVTGLSGHGQVAQLINDQQVVLGQLADFFLQLSFHFGQFQLFDQIQRITKQHTVSSLDRLVANPDGQVGLADSRWTNKDQIITLVDKLKIEQGIDLALADRGLMTVVKAFQMLLRRKTGCLAVALYTAAVSPAQLILSKPASKAQVGHFTLLGFG